MQTLTKFANVEQMKGEKMSYLTFDTEREMKGANFDPAFTKIWSDFVEEVLKYKTNCAYVLKYEQIIAEWETEFLRGVEGVAFESSQQVTDAIFTAISELENYSFIPGKKIANQFENSLIRVAERHGAQVYFPPVNPNK